VLRSSGVFVFCWHPLFGGGLAFSLASALRLRGAGVAPVRGGTPFSLLLQRKGGKRKQLTPSRLP
jgi:hypothetical protein